MKIADMNWEQVEEYLQRDDRCILPLGSTEQHAYLSLATDSILAERVSVEAAEPLRIPVFPPINYGITPQFRAYPGTITMRVETFLHMVRDALDCLAEQGFKRILLVNGHGGNSPASSMVLEWMADHPGMRVKFHNWWNAPKTWAKVQAIDTFASHASWMENFPWTRLLDVMQPRPRKPMVDFEYLRTLGPKDARSLLGDGNFGGYYERPDEEMLALWKTGVEETRAMLADLWEK